MTPTTLRAWIKSRRLSHDEAAELLAMSRNSLRKNIYGQNAISRQTKRIIELLDRPEE